MSPATVQMTEDLRVVQEKWLRADRDQRDLIYYREFAPLFVPSFSALPLHGFPAGRLSVKALISVLGLSWQPVALMSAWAHPERILILGTPDSLRSKVDGDPVSEVIANVSGIPRHLFEVEELGDNGEIGIYRSARAFLEKHRLQPRELALDPTGGKKSMSASAALVGFLAGAWILYVDYNEYDATGRIPVAGTEYPRLLRNPLEVFGTLDFRTIKEAFNRGNYEEAQHLAQNLAARLYEPREAEALALLSQGYGAWHAFRFAEAQEAMEKCLRNLECFGAFGRWGWSNEVCSALVGTLPVVREINRLASRMRGGDRPGSMEEGVPFVLNHLASAQRALDQNQLGVAILLTYSSLERYIDLTLWAQFGLDDENPDFTRLSVDMELFHQKGQALLGKTYQPKELRGPVGLSLGVQLLAALRPELLPEDFFKPIRGLMQERNKCEFEHGISAEVLERSRIERYLRTVKNAIRRGIPELEERLVPYFFPRLTR